MTQYDKTAELIVRLRQTGGGEIADALEQQAARINELEQDAARYRFVLPIVTGTDSDKAAKIVMAIAMQLMKGLDGDAAIDAAMNSTKENQK